jgi:hypothetical protein
MYKALCVATLLLAAFTFVWGSKPVAATAAGLPGPVILTRMSLMNQTSAIPATTLFTPTANGLYRVSAYMAMTVGEPTNQDGYWNLSLNWTDDAGAENDSQLYLYVFEAPEHAFSATSGDLDNTYVVRAIAGVPVTFSVSNNNNAGGTYEVFLTVEKL